MKPGQVLGGTWPGNDVFLSDCVAILAPLRAYNAKSITWDQLSRLPAFGSPPEWILVMSPALRRLLWSFCRELRLDGVRLLMTIVPVGDFQARCPPPDVRVMFHPWALASLYSPRNISCTWILLLTVS